MEPVRIVKESYSKTRGMYSVERCRLSNWQPLVWPAWVHYEITRVTREPEFEIEDDDFDW